MISFDLKCAGLGHVFEAWFANSASYEDQRVKGLIQCPYCGKTSVEKAAMAPNLPVKANRRSSPPPSTSVAKVSDSSAKEIMAALAQAQAKILDNSVWVGRDFDSQARAMDAGEIDSGIIHGEVTQDEAKALIEDGIGVMPLPLPVIPPQKRN